MQGSGTPPGQTGAISNDLNRQVLSLLTQGPGSYSGTFVEGLDELKKLAEDIADGKPIDSKKATGVIKAVQEGIDSYKKAMSDYYGDTGQPLPPEIQAIIDDLEALKASLDAPLATLTACANTANSTNTGGQDALHTFINLDEICPVTEPDRLAMGGAKGVIEDAGNEIYAYYITPLNSDSEQIDNLSLYELIGTTSVLRIGDLPNGQCIPFSAGQGYAFCSADKPDINLAKKQGLIDEVGFTNLKSLTSKSKNWLDTQFIIPFVAYNVTDISDNFRDGYENRLEITNLVSLDAISSSDNFNLFEKKLVDIIFKNNQNLNLLQNQFFIDAQINPPNLSEKLWGLIPKTIYLAMGGTQQVDFKVNVYRLKNLTESEKKVLSNYAFNIDYTIHDTFGMDWEDVNSGSKGEASYMFPLRAAFALQHYHGYHPFFTFIKYQRTFKYLRK